MKIKDLPQDKSLADVRFIYPGDGKTYVWTGQWNKGVWGRLDGDPSKNRIHPLFVEDLKEALEWEVVEPQPAVQAGLEMNRE